MAASKVKNLQLWCKRQCDGYRDVNVVNMTSSWKSGMAFCAIIHRYRPDLIDYNSLKKENVFENNKLAFDTAAVLGIPALLDAEDMVAMTTPDKLCIVTYVSQYYNYFHNKEPKGGPGVQSAVKRPAAAAVEPQPAKRIHTLTDSCALCGEKVYLLERHMNGSKLFHRRCIREQQRTNTLTRAKERAGVVGEGGGKERAGMVEQGRGEDSVLSSTQFLKHKPEALNGASHAPSKPSTGETHDSQRFPGVLLRSKQTQELDVRVSSRPGDRVSHASTPVSPGPAAGTKSSGLVPAGPRPYMRSENSNDTGKDSKVNSDAWRSPVVSALNPPALPKSSPPTKNTTISTRTSSDPYSATSTSKPLNVANISTIQSQLKHTSASKPVFSSTFQSNIQSSHVNNSVSHVKPQGTSEPSSSASTSQHQVKTSASDTLMMKSILASLNGKASSAQPAKVTKTNDSNGISSSQPKWNSPDNQRNIAEAGKVSKFAGVKNIGVTSSNTESEGKSKVSGSPASSSNSQSPGNDYLAVKAKLKPTRTTSPTIVKPLKPLKSVSDTGTSHGTSHPSSAVTSTKTTTVVASKTQTSTHSSTNYSNITKSHVTTSHITTSHITTGNKTTSPHSQLHSNQVPSSRVHSDVPSVTPASAAATVSVHSSGDTVSSVHSTLTQPRARITTVIRATHATNDSTVTAQPQLQPQPKHTTVIRPSVPSAIRPSVPSAIRPAPPAAAVFNSGSTDVSTKREVETSESVASVDSQSSSSTERISTTPHIIRPAPSSPKSILKPCPDQTPPPKPMRAQPVVNNFSAFNLNDSMEMNEGFQDPWKMEFAARMSGGGGVAMQKSPPSKVPSLAAPKSPPQHEPENTTKVPVAPPRSIGSQIRAIRRRLEDVDGQLKEVDGEKRDGENEEPDEMRVEYRSPDQPSRESPRFRSPDPPKRENARFRSPDPPKRESARFRSPESQATHRDDNLGEEEAIYDNRVYPFPPKSDARSPERSPARAHDQPAQNGVSHNAGRPDPPARRRVVPTEQFEFEDLHPDPAPRPHHGRLPHSRVPPPRPTSGPSRAPAPHPAPRRQVSAEPHVSVEFMGFQLEQLDAELRGLEDIGRGLEERIRIADDMEEDTLMVEWFSLVSRKNELVRTEADLMHRQKQQELEEQHECIEQQLRATIEKPDTEKTKQEKKREENLMSQLLAIIDQRNSIVDSMEEDRLRYLAEDQEIEALLARKGFKSP